MDARHLDDLKTAPLLPAAVDAAAQTTGAGNWLDVSNADGDVAIIVNIGSHAGAYGSLKVQLQSATDVNGTSAANVTNGSVTAVADGSYVFAVGVDALANKFIGVVCTYTTITSATMSVNAAYRNRSN